MRDDGDFLQLLFYLAVAVVFGIVMVSSCTGYDDDRKRLNAKSCSWTGKHYSDVQGWDGTTWTDHKFEYDCAGSLEWSKVRPEDVKAGKR